MQRALLTCLLSTASLAAVATAALADPPARVGRIAYFEGEVSFQPPEVDQWVPATRNYPVAPGESFWTGDDGRAELQIGAVDARLDGETELDVVDVDYGEMRLGLPQGSLDIRLWRDPRRPVVIATPAGDVRLDARGLYRIDVGAPQEGYYPPVEVTVFEGAADAPSPEGLAPVQSGQAALIYAGYDPALQYAQDAFIDDWARHLEARMRWRPTDDAADLTGVGDLYASGEFVADPQYGQVWFPRDLPEDWAPYRYGHWAYVEPWGYTWIDDQPWGFAPFHYGRWAQFGGRWGWVPGRPTPEPVYAPALVAFFGGGGWRVGDAEAIGWAPLAPDEAYRPGYAVSADYQRRVNGGSVRLGSAGVEPGGGAGPGGYRNARAATVMRTADFSGARPVRTSALAITPTAIAAAPPAAPGVRPPPSAWARTGVAPRQGQAPPLPPAARPPAALAVVRRAVVSPAPAPGRPPVIAGARIAPPAVRPAPGGGPAASAMIAPAQMRRPAPRPAAGGAALPPPYGGARLLASPPRSPAPEPPRRATQTEPPEAGDAARTQADQARRAQAREAEAAQAQAERARQAQTEAAQTQARQAQAAQAQAERARQAQMQSAEAQARDAQMREAQMRAQGDQARAAAAARLQAQRAQEAQAAQARARAAQAQRAAPPKPQPPPARKPEEGGPTPQP